MEGPPIGNKRISHTLGHLEARYDGPGRGKQKIKKKQVSKKAWKAVEKKEQKIAFLWRQGGRLFVSR